jgi:hypothetical protein
MKNKFLFTLLLVIGLSVISCETQELVKSESMSANDILVTKTINGNISPCGSGPDATVSNLRVIHVSGGNSFTVLFEVHNIGTGDLLLPGVSIQTYLSKDNILDDSDLSTGGATVI